MYKNRLILYIFFVFIVITSSHAFTFGTETFNETRELGRTCNRDNFHIQPWVCSSLYTQDRYVAVGVGRDYKEAYLNAHYNLGYFYLLLMNKKMEELYIAIGLGKRLYKDFFEYSKDYLTKMVRPVKVIDSWIDNYSGVNYLLISTNKEAADRNLKRIIINYYKKDNKMIYKFKNRDGSTYLNNYFDY